MAPKPPSPDDQSPAPADDPELAKKLAVGTAAVPPAGGKPAGAPPDEGDDDEEDELELHAFGPRNFIRETGYSAYDNARKLSRGFCKSEGTFRLRDKLARENRLTDSRQCIIMRP